MPTAMEIAERIAAKPPIAVHHIKQNMRLGAETPLDRHLVAESAAQRVCLLSEDTQEAGRAFKEKRPPVFRGQ